MKITIHILKRHIAASQRACVKAEPSIGDEPFVTVSKHKAKGLLRLTVHPSAYPFLGPGKKNLDDLERELAAEARNLEYLDPSELWISYKIEDKSAGLPLKFSTRCPVE